jgi:hypothetical protein
VAAIRSSPRGTHFLVNTLDLSLDARGVDGGAEATAMNRRSEHIGCAPSERPGQAGCSGELFQLEFSNEFGTDDLAQALAVGGCLG